MFLPGAADRVDAAHGGARLQRDERAGRGVHLRWYLEGMGPTPAPEPENLLALITVGGHDEVRPFCAEVMLRGIRNFEPMIFEDSSHSAHLKDLVRYLAPLPGCLARVDTTEAA